MEKNDSFDQLLARIDALSEENAKLQSQTLALTAIIVNMAETKSLPSSKLGAAVDLIANSNSDLPMAVRSDAKNLLSMIERISQERS